MLQSMGFPGMEHGLATEQHLWVYMFKIIKFGFYFAWEYLCTPNFKKCREGGSSRGQGGRWDKIVELDKKYCVYCLVEGELTALLLYQLHGHWAVCSEYFSAGTEISRHCRYHGYCYKENPILIQCWKCFFDMSFCCFGYYNYTEWPASENSASAWLLNSSAFVRDPAHLWMARRKKLTHLLLETCHSRGYLQD